MCVDSSHFQWETLGPHERPRTGREELEEAQNGKVKEVKLPCRGAEAVCCLHVRRLWKDAFSGFPRRDLRSQAWISASDAGLFYNSPSPVLGTVCKVVRERSFQLRKVPPDRPSKGQMSAFTVQGS